MTGEAWLLIAAGLAVGGVSGALIAAIGWHNGYAAAMHRVTVRTIDCLTTSREAREVEEAARRGREFMRRELADARARRAVEGTDPIEHFPAGWPDKTVMN